MHSSRSILLYGLVLAGGYSRRMGTDKALLHYYGASQAEVCYNLLSPFCTKVFVSRRKEQEKIDLPLLFDEFLHAGPLGGIVTAMKAFPQVAWFVLACDYPFLRAQTLEILVRQRDPRRYATAFVAKDNLPEPLCTIYEPKSFRHLIKSLSRNDEKTEQCSNASSGHACPRKTLLTLRIHTVVPPSFQEFFNANEPWFTQEEERRQNLDATCGNKGSVPHPLGSLAKWF